MIRVIKQYGISLLLLIMAIFCLFNISKNIEDAFTVITNSIALFIIIIYFINFEKENLLKIKRVILNIKLPFHGQTTKKILNIFLSFIIKKRWEIISYLFLLLLLIITLGQFSYLEKFINLTWINKYKTILTVLAISSGGLTFWHNRKRIEKESEEEQNKEQLEEQKRKEDFENKYPKIAKLNFKYDIKNTWKNKKYLITILKIIISPIIFISRLPYCLIKWIYKEKWVYSICLIIIIILGIFFYFDGIGQYGFQGDEYYHVKVTQNYFENGKLFHLDENNEYTRSKFTSLLPIASNYFFNYLFPFKNFSNEFTFRFPIAIFSIFSIILIYFISKSCFNKLYSLFITSIFTTEIWFIYFAKYLRFYSPSLFFILLLLYIAIKYKSIFSFILSIVISLLCWQYLQTYFLFITIAIILINIIKRHNSNFKSIIKKLLLITVAVICLYTYYYFTQSSNTSSYNSVSFSINFKNIYLQLKWLLLNYSVFLVLTIISSLLLLKNNIFKKNIGIIIIFCWLSLIFFFGYVNNVPFNFTNRPLYFVLPFMFITSIYIARITLKKSLILILFSIILILNTQESIIYNISAPGDKYYPTKLIFEKHEIIFGNKDIAEFVKNYMVDKNRTTIKIIAIGLNDLSLWSDIKLDKIYDWHYNNFDEYKEILSNFKKDDILLVHATAIKKRNNKYYKIIHDKNSVTEVDPKYYEYILKNINEYELIYTSKDGYSKIYKKLCN